MCISCFHLMLPFDLLLRKVFYKKTNRIFDISTGIEFWNDVALFISVIIWVGSFFALGSYIDTNEFHKVFSSVTSLSQNQYYMLAILTVIDNISVEAIDAAAAVTAEAATNSTAAATARMLQQGNR